MTASRRGVSVAFHKSPGTFAVVIMSSNSKYRTNDITSTGNFPQSYSLPFDIRATSYANSNECSGFNTPIQISEKVG